MNNEPNTLVIEDESIARGYVQIPRRLLLARNLSRDAKLLYGFFLHYAWQDQQCFPGVERLCYDMGCGETKFREYFNELRKAGAIRVERRGLGKTNIYYLTDLKKADLKIKSFEPTPKAEPRRPEDQEPRGDQQASDLPDPQMPEDPDPRRGNDYVEPGVLETALPINSEDAVKEKDWRKRVKQARGKSNPDPSTLWSSVLASLEKQMTQANYRTWLEGTEAVKLDAQAITVRCGTEFKRDWLEQRMAGHIRRELAAVAERQMEVRFTC